MEELFKARRIATEKILNLNVAYREHDAKYKTITKEIELLEALIRDIVPKSDEIVQDFQAHPIFAEKEETT